MLKEKLRRAIKQRPPRNIGAPGNTDDPALKQGLHDAVHINPAYRLEVRPRDRLPVGNNGKGLERGRTQARRTVLREKLPDPWCRVGRGDHLPTGATLDEAEAALLFFVSRRQLAQNGSHFIRPAFG